MQHLSRATRLAYAVGQISAGLKSTAFHFFLLVFYRQVLGMDGYLAGLASALALVADAITDPLVGQLSDNWRSKRWGRRHGFMALSALPFGLSMYMVFSPPAGLSEGALFIWLLFWAIAVRSFLTLFYVPHLSLGAELVKDYDGRTKLSGLRTSFGYLGGLLMNAFAFGVLFHPDSGGLTNKDAYHTFAVILGCAGTLSVLVSTFGTFHTRKDLPQISAASTHKWYSVLVDSWQLFSLRNFRIFAVAIVFFMAMAGTAQNLLTYYGIYFFGFSEPQLFLISLGVLFALWPAQKVAQLLSARFDKGPALMIAFFTGGFVGTMSPVLRLLGIYPENGDPMLLPIVFTVYIFNQIFIIGGVIILLSMIADMVDEYDVKSGMRREGLFFAAYSFSEKLSFALGTLLAGIALDIIKFPKNAAPSDVPDTVLFDFGIVAGPVLFTILLVSVICFSRYSLTREKVKKLQAEIAARDT